MTILRSSPTPVYYGSHRTSVTWDEVTVATAVAVGMLGLAWLCIAPTCKKKRTSFLVNFGYFFALFVFVVAIRT